jgi:hypothetical protein
VIDQKQKRSRKRCRAKDGFFPKEVLFDWL